MNVIDTEKHSPLTKFLGDRYLMDLFERYGLNGIDIDAEFKLIQKKQSKLSASKRRAVELFHAMRQQTVTTETK